MKGLFKVRGRGYAIAVATLAALSMMVTAASAGVTTETEDVFGQGMTGPVVSPGGATLQRSDSGLSVKLTMPTPEPGSYFYPGTDQPPGGLVPPATGPVGFPPAVPGHPEAYSLWMFVFNAPGECAGDPCTIADFSRLAPTSAGAFNAGGHLVGGQNLQLSGRVTLSSAPFAGQSLTNPHGSEVHLAVAPHGALDPALLPDMINLPIGNPAYWWLAIFEQ